MARLNDLGVGKMEAPKLRPELIIIRPDYNYRDMSLPETRAHIAWLKESIRTEGVKKPIDVNFVDGKVYLEAGQCRLTAAQELRQEGWDGYIPCFSVKGDEAEVLARSIIDNTALPPTMLEFGVAARRLQKFGWEPDAIARLLPVTLADTPAKALKFVRDALELDAAPLEVKKAVRDGVNGVKVSPALAVSAVKKNSLMAGQVIAEEAEKAKAAGKREAKRPKGAGKAAKAKEAVVQRVRSLEWIGDQMAETALAYPVDLKRLDRLANTWVSARAAK
jgi:hypothetical protein